MPPACWPGEPETSASVRNPALSDLGGIVPAMSSTRWLRRQAVGWSLARSADLGGAMARLGFVQADPIRAPAPAQDLILRHRVPGYRVGDLDRGYPTLPLEEDHLYAYGFLARPLRRFLHPRSTVDGEYRPTGLAAEVLAYVRAAQRSPSAEPGGDVRPDPRHQRLGWAVGGDDPSAGGAAPARAGAGDAAGERGAGLRAGPPLEPVAPPRRARAVATLIARILAPVPEATLRATLPGALSRGVGGRAAVVKALLSDGELAATQVDGVRYVWPADLSPVEGEPEGRVRLLAPFDPVVWDRRRFEHLWGWAYRFEAYTPAAKRRLGYYALPLLWRDRVIGWANCVRSPEGVTVQTGFVDGAPRQRRFAAALEAEVARLTTFLTPRVGRGPAQSPPAPRSGGDRPARLATG